MDIEDKDSMASFEYLKGGDKEIQKEAMREWFFENYEDPVENCPVENGYVYIWGGPHCAAEVLYNEFESFVPNKVIEELADKLAGICVGWSTKPKPEDYDLSYFDDLAANTQACETFRDNLNKIDLFLRNKDSLDTDSEFLYQLLFSQVITILETYLSDLFISTVSKDQNLMKRFIETCPDFGKEKFKLCEIYDVVEQIEKRAKGKLVYMVWHNFPKVKGIYKSTLEIEFNPNFVRSLMREIEIRHDLVHRNGKTKDGQKVIVTELMLDGLIDLVKQFATDIDHKMANVNQQETEPL